MNILNYIKRRSVTHGPLQNMWFVLSFLGLKELYKKGYGNLYFMTMTNLGSIVVDKDGEEHDMFQLQRKWISKAKLGRRTKH